MDKQVDSIRRFVDSNINDMVDERRETLQKYEKQFNSIKSVCCKYFEKYDVELEAVSIKAQNVMDKYTDWSKVLIEPASMNDARLFSLESRVHQEEELRTTTLATITPMPTATLQSHVLPWRKTKSHYKRTK